MSTTRTRRRTAAAEMVLGDSRESLLDIVDHVLNKGVVLSGDLTIGLAGVDLIYARLSLLLCAAERVLPAPPPERRRSAAGGRGRRRRASPVRR